MSVFNLVQPLNSTLRCNSVRPAGVRCSVHAMSESGCGACKVWGACSQFCSGWGAQAQSVSCAAMSSAVSRAQRSASRPPPPRHWRRRVYREQALPRNGHACNKSAATHFCSSARPRPGLTAAGMGAAWAQAQAVEGTRGREAVNVRRSGWGRGGAEQRRGDARAQAVGLRSGREEIGDGGVAQR